MSQEPPAAGRRVDEGHGAHPTTERLAPAAPLAPPVVRRAGPPGPLRWILPGGAVVLALALVFLLTRPSDPMSDTRPVEVVRGFAAAIEARDASGMLAFVEPTVYRREISPEIRAYAEYLQAASFENARYELLDSDGEVAHVRWTATMRYTLGMGGEARSGERPIDTTFELRKIEGSWYLHGAKLPATSSQ
jgi:hypothetical protein